jgi:hypothetical protein
MKIRILTAAFLGAVLLATAGQAADTKPKPFTVTSSS